MHQKLLPLIDQLERAVDCDDSVAIVEVLSQLDRETIYSGNEVYTRLRKLESRLFEVLLNGMPAREFGTVVTTTKHLYSFRAWEAIEKCENSIDAAALWDIKDSMGFPSSDAYPKLYAKLVAANDESLSIQLVDAIDRIVAEVAPEGSSFLAHQKFMTNFRFIHWLPSDHKLSDHVRLLAARKDVCAKSATRRYLLELPWGKDRRATWELISGLMTREDAETKALLCEALEAHAGPAILRLWLRDGICGNDVGAFLRGLFCDLASSTDDSDRLTLVEQLDSSLSEVASNGSSVDQRDLANEATSIDTSGWSKLIRGYFGVVLHDYLPEADVSRVSTSIERTAIRISRAWERLRGDHLGLGCLVPVVLLMLLTFLGPVALDSILGEPRGARLVPHLLLMAWAIWSLGTVRTHFSGNESLRFKVVAATGYFALFSFAIIAAVIVRI